MMAGYAKCCQLADYADFHGLKSIWKRHFANEHWLAHNQNFTNYENLPKNLLNTISATMPSFLVPLLRRSLNPWNPRIQPTNKETGK